MSGQHIGSYDQIARLPSHPEGISELGRKDQAGGYLGIPASGPILGTFGQRVDTEANLAEIVLEDGELAYASDTQSWFVGDGVTAGGSFLWQKPQWKSLTYASGELLTALPTLPTAAVSSEAILFPRISGARYAIRITARFVGDTDDASNFAVGLREEAFGGPVLDYAHCTLNFHWYTYGNINAAELESRCLTAGPTNIALGEKLVLVDNLTLAGATIIAEGTWEMQTAASMVWGGMVICGMTRTGSASPAAVELVAECQRIA